MMVKNAKHDIYNVILVKTEGNVMFIETEGNTILASVKSKGLAYRVAQEFKKVYGDANIFYEPSHKRKL